MIMILNIEFKFSCLLQNKIFNSIKTKLKTLNINYCHFNKFVNALDLLIFNIFLFNMKFKNLFQWLKLQDLIINQNILVTFTEFQFTFLFLTFYRL